MICIIGHYSVRWFVTIILPCRPLTMNLLGCSSRRKKTIPALKTAFSMAAAVVKMTAVGNIFSLYSAHIVKLIKY